MVKYNKISAHTSPNKCRKITAASDPGSVHPAFEDLEDRAYHAGYDLTVLGNSIEDAEFILKPQSSDNMLPALTVWLDRSEMESNGIVYYECSAKFPTLDSRNMNFYDDPKHYVTNVWAKVAEFMSSLLHHGIVLDHYEDDEDED